MLLEVGITFAVYMGVRLYEKYTKKPPKSRRVKPVKKSQIAKKIVDTSETAKQYEYYLKISTISMGLSAIRQFIFPPLGLLSLGLYIHTFIPFMKKVEKSLFKERQVNVDVLFFLGDILTLAINQYLAAAFEVWLFHAARNTALKTKSQSEKMLINVFEQQPRQVWVLEDNVEIEIPIEKVKVNDILVVNTGEVIPVDGLITDGLATIDQQALTGESQPAEKEVGDRSR